MINSKWKPMPHQLRCGIYSGYPNICTCNTGTRWYGYGHRCDDAISIQGIATFFANLQPPVAYAYEFSLDETCSSDPEFVSLKKKENPFGRRGHDFQEDAVVTEIPLYASPGTSAFRWLPEGWRAVFAPFDCNGNRVCPFCGCNTNANAMACCERGAEESLKSGAAMRANNV